MGPLSCAKKYGTVHKCSCNCSSVVNTMIVSVVACKTSQLAFKDVSRKFFQCMLISDPDHELAHDNNKILPRGS